MYFRTGNLAIILGLVNIVVFSVIFYFSVFQGISKRESLVENIPRFDWLGRNDVSKVQHNVIPASNFGNIQDTHGKDRSGNKSVFVSSAVASKKNIPAAPLVMEGCPPDWPHEIVRLDSAGRLAAQVCRSSKGDSAWKCATGWERVRGDPYCIKTPSSASDIYANSGERNFVALEPQTPHQFVSENYKLIFRQLPGTSVEVSPSVFRAVRENEAFENYHEFTFIMHPCSRLIRLWEEISYPRGEVSFTSFLNDRLPPWKPLLLSNEVNFQAQTEMLFDFKGNFLLDQYLFYEKWNHSLQKLAQNISRVKAWQMFKALPSNERRCENMYTTETWDKMKNSYAMDFCVFNYSKDIDSVHTLPSEELTEKKLLFQYRRCQRIVTRTRLNKVINSQHLSKKFRDRPAVSPSPCTIYTYYQAAYDAPSIQLASQNLLGEWTKAWTMAGWQPRILNESDAMRHPEYKNLREKFEELPTVNSKRYEVSCFLRYVAMAAVGGGWMSDFDLFPLHFPPCAKPPFNGSLTVCSAFVPCLVSASEDDYIRAAHLMADVGRHWQMFPDITVDKQTLRPQVSDMNTLQILIDIQFVRTLEFVIEASDLVYGELACNKSSHLFWSHNSDQAPPGMSSLPWAVHISHEFLYHFQDKLDTKWSELSWKTGEVSDVDSFRPSFIPKVLGILRKLCHL